MDKNALEVGLRVKLNAPDNVGTDYTSHNGELGTITQVSTAWGDAKIVFDNDFRDPLSRRGFINPREGWSLDCSWFEPARVPSTIRESW